VPDRSLPLHLSVKNCTGHGINGILSLLEYTFSSAKCTIVMQS